MMFPHAFLTPVLHVPVAAPFFLQLLQEFLQALLLAVQAHQFVSYCPPQVTAPPSGWL